MVYSRLPLLWAAILCCAANAEPLPTPSGTNRVLLTASSSTTSLSQQDVSTSSPTTLLSSSSKLPDSTSSSFQTSSTLVTPSQSSSASLSTTSSHTYVWVPLPPPTISYNTSTPQTISSDEGSGPYTSLLNSTVLLTSGGDVVSGISPSTIAATSTATSDDREVEATAISSSSGEVAPPFTGLNFIPESSTKQVVPPLPSFAPNKGSQGSLSTLISTSVQLNIPTSNIASSQGSLTTTILTSLQLNSSSLTSLPFKHHNATSTNHYSNVTTSTHKPTSSHHYHNTSSRCTSLTPGETLTVWSILPNTNTITITLTKNETNTYTTTPEFTPPVICTPKLKSSESKASSTPTSLWWPPFEPHSSSTVLGAGELTSAVLGPHLSSAAVSDNPAASSEVNSPSPPITTVVITSKNPVTQFTTQSVPAFPGGGKTQMQSVTTTSYSWGPLPPPSATGGAPVTTTTGIDNIGGIGGAPGGVSQQSGGGGIIQLSVSPVQPTTVNVGGVTVVVGPSSVAIGTQTLTPGSGGSGDSGDSGGSGESAVSEGSGGGLNTIITQGGETFTVNPSQVIGPGTVISIPTNAGGAVFMEGPTPTVVDGVTVAVGNSVAVVGGSTFSIGAGAPEETIVVNNENISIGPGGVGFVDATITPAAALPTNVVVFDGDVFSVVGASVAVFDGSSFTFTGGTPLTTVFNGDTITAGPSGFIIDGTSTLGGPNHPTGTQYGVAGGIYVSEIGSTLAVIDGTTLTIGPGATLTTVTIEGHTITAGPSGISIGGSNGGITTLNFPFNPTTQEVTAGGVTFSEIGSSLVDIGGTTFTIGAGATPTTDVYNGQTISIGPGGIGFATTTVTSFVSSPTATSTKKKNGGAVLGPPLGGALGMCIALGVGLLV